jgi:hypothetical protein
MINRLAMIVALVVGVFMVGHYFVKTEMTDLIYVTLLDYYQIIFAVTMIIGGISLFRHQTVKLQRAPKQEWFSGVTVAAILFMVVAAALFGTGATSPYQWAFNNLQAPMQATTFALLAFFVASAAYRGFRIRSKPALVLALAAVIVLIGRSAFGEMISQQLPVLAGWVLNNPSVAAKRGILIGVGLGSVATALRVILGIERSYM